MTFQGSGANKYANELLELIANFDFEFPEGLMKVIKNNWLVNLTGYKAGWFPGDLMQEHNVRLLKKMAQRRDAEFGGPFFSEIIARNIRAFMSLKRFLPDSLRLGKMSETHGTAKALTVSRMVDDASKLHAPHIFRAGRSFGFKARDDYQAGYRLLLGGKLDAFLQRTIRDPLAVQGTDDSDCGTLDLPEEEEDRLPRQPVYPAIVSEDGNLMSLEENRVEEDEESEADTDASEEEDM